MHALADWAPVATKMRRHVGESSAWAAASEIRTPFASAIATLIGTVWPAFHFELADGEKKPRIRYSTRYGTETVVEFPATSVAEQVSVCGPVLFVSGAWQLCVAIPEVPSVACGVAVADPWSRIVTGLMVGASDGATESILSASDPVAQFQD